MGDNPERNGTQNRGEPAVDRRSILQTTGVAAAAAVGAQSAAAKDGSNGPRSREATTTAARSTSSVSTEDYTIESYDGTELGATLYTPEGTGPYPSVLMTHGWGAFRQSPITVPKALNYAKNGYAVLTYDSRGFASSEGTVGLNGPRETQDAQYLISWLANRSEIATEGADNPWIGMDGISYAGGIQFQVASADDRLDAMVPRITWNDLQYSLTPNGVIKIGWLSALLGLGEFNTLLDGDADLTDKLSDWYWYAVENNAVPDEALDFFEEGSVGSKDDIDTPTFLLQGWNDSLFNPSEALDTYEQLQDAGVDSRLAFYEGGHDLTEVTVDFEDRGKMNNDALAWMNRHVRGQATDIPSVQNYLPQRDKWRQDDDWPPTDVATERYDLSNAVVDGDNEIEQNAFSMGSEEVTYEWVVGEDIEVIGEPEIDLGVDVNGSEARLFFELFHNGDNINGMDEAILIPSSGTHQVNVTYPGIQEFVQDGDTVGLNVSVSNLWYQNSRDSDGVTIRPGDSSLHLPKRPDGNAPDDDDDDDGSLCFITTATARDTATLNSLRRFRDESMSATPLGRGMVGLYYRISPPIAETLERHPESRTADATRSIVETCASLSDEQDETASSVKSAAIGVLLTILYMVGIIVSATGHAGINLLEWFGDDEE